uniref:Small ribosomal subunit protein uS3c n=1 Tax=Enhalus acoroides TaxID=55455 RepID=A0A6M3QGL1_9LILI|nr:ribosomal protein S3 [Enhalus acoroides]YP_009828902.1 ribosomal protein S3 [Enhalus acoroides]QJC59112.1 ribosomal protein S3 [Enhalus acoroides]QJC59134.1 ribosomal protein S3 [Enhalus acoroides]QNH93495.1 ribosomal protein S3 [Enhalus acoroides]QNH93523.1 ribosomal protein S3 [Enhalus acoroides]UWV91982.1 ribosomal protein S3 [Enhalus acoroides]
MGKKINSLGFRLGTTQSHHSLWFARPNHFPAGLQEDERIRDCIKNYVQKKMEVSPDFDLEQMTHIIIQKTIDSIKVLIPMGFPNVLAEKENHQTKKTRELRRNVQKKLNPMNQILKFDILIKKIEQPYGQPKILAEYIASQLKNRVSFRKAMKKAMEFTEQTDTKGIQIQIAGRIGGKDKAHVIWIREGRVPLQTIRAKMDYCSYTVRTIDGALGIKIWIFVDEEEY